MEVVVYLVPDAIVAQGASAQDSLEGKGDVLQCRVDVVGGGRRLVRGCSRGEVGDGYGLAALEGGEESGVHSFRSSILEDGAAH